MQIFQISASVVAFVSNLGLRVQLVNNLPAHTPQLQLFRRRLALAFFFEDPSYMMKSSDSLLTISVVAKHLEDSTFDINKDTDYKELSGLISLLDIGIDDGFPSSGQMKHLRKRSSTKKLIYLLVGSERCIAG